MEELTQERINELYEQAIEDIKQWAEEKNDIFDINDYDTDYILTTIKNINSITDKRTIVSEIQYWSCSSNYWNGVNCLLQAYIERL